MPKSGSVVLVGAGPGDPGLVTVKGLAAIRAADCLVYDRLVSPELVAEAREGCELVDVGKSKGRHSCPQEEINAVLIEKASEGKRVVRLKGGDPFVFGRGGEEALALRAAGIAYTVIPGVTSAVAGPAAAGIPVTHRGLARSLRIVTAHGADGNLPDFDFSLMARGDETCVFMMGLSRVGDLAAKLIAAGRSAATPAAVVSSATLPGQRTVRGTLSDIAARVEEAGLPSPAVFIVGAVAELDL